MAASSQYSLTWRSKMRKMFNIFINKHCQKEDKLLLILVALNLEFGLVSRKTSKMQEIVHYSGEERI